MSAVLLQVDGYDPVAAAAVTLRASSVDDDRVCHLDGQTWWPAIARLPELRYDLVDAGFSGRIETPGSTIVLAVEPFPLLPRYTLADARVRLWTGEPGATWASYTLRFDGRATAQPRIADGRASLPIAVDDRWLDTPLLAVYAGTGGAEGDASLKGRAKPLSIGAARFVPAQLIDATNLVLQVSAYGAIEDVETAFERVLRFSASAGDHASYAALVAASIPAGRWATAKAVGMVRHGAPPVPGGRFSYHVKGDKGGPDGWVRLPGAIIKRLALLAGGTGKYDEASLDALDAARPYNLSWHIAEQMSAGEAIQRLAASVNAVAGVSWLSKLFVAPLPALAGTPAVSLDATGAALPPVGQVEQIEMDPPFWRMAIEAERTWDVHALSDVAFTAVLVDRGAYAAGETYREGHIVQDQGSSWLYINPTPASGNAPPALPTTSNAWWRVLAQQGPTGATGAAGVNAVTGYLTNEAHTVAAAADGTGYSLTGSGGTFKVFDGTADKSGTAGPVTYSVIGAQPQNGLTMSITSAGVYSLSGAGWTTDGESFTLRAVYGGVTIDKVYRISKSKAGSTGSAGATGPGGPVVALAVSPGQGFTFTDGAADPSSQTLTFTATKQNTSEAINWTTSPSVALGGTGDTRTLTVANFGANRQVVVTATGATSGAADSITVLKLEEFTYDPVAFAALQQAAEDAANDGILSADEKFRDIFPALRAFEHRFIQLMERAAAVGIGPTKHNEISSDMADWTPILGLTLTVNAATDPFGALTAAKIVHSSTGAAERRITESTNKAAAGYSFFGILAKHVHGFHYMRWTMDTSGDIYWDLRTGHAASAGRAAHSWVRRGSIPLNDGWRFYWGIHQGGIDATDTHRVYFLDQVGSTQTTAGFTGGEVHVCRPHQGELNSIPAFFATTASDTAPVAGNAIADAAVAARSDFLCAIASNVTPDIENAATDSAIIPFDNILTSTHTLTAWTDIGTPVLTRVDGYWQINDDSAAATEGKQQVSALTYAAGTKITALARIAKDATGRATRFASIRIFQTSDSTGAEVLIDTQTGEISTSVTGTFAVIEAEAIGYDTSDWLVYVTAALTAASPVRCDLFPARGASASWALGAAATGSTKFLHPQMFVGTIAERARRSLADLLGAWARAMDALQKAISGLDGTTSLQIDGAKTINIAATVAGDASANLPHAEVYTAKTGLGPAVGATFTVTVVSGSINCSIGSTSGNLSITALGSLEAKIRIDCAYNGIPGQSLTVTVNRKDAAPSTGTSGGGGTDVSNVSTFASVNSTTFTTIATLTRTVTSATPALNATLTTVPQLSGGTGTWNVELKWVRENGATDVDIGATANSDPDAVVGTDGEGGPTRENGSVTCNRAESGRTIGVQYTWYLQAKLTSGTRTINFTGSASITG